MRKIATLLVFTFLLFSCDDGDIITEVTEIEFDDSFNICDVDMTDQDISVVYKTRTAPNESLSLQISSSGITINSLVETAEDTNNNLLVNLVNPESETIDINATNIFKFRSYDNDPSNLFCLDIPPANINVLNEFDSVSGMATFVTTLIEDDNDGIPAELEDINNNGNLMDDDTDNDGLPNYIDADDDGDNVLTASESVNYTEADGLANALDTDMDGMPNYLDNDDDGDDVPTRNEENDTQDNNPTNDFTSGNTADYLNELVFDQTFIATGYREHTIQQTFVIELQLESINFPDVIYEVSTFGTLANDISGSRSVFPNFN